MNSVFSPIKNMTLDQRTLKFPEFFMSLISSVTFLSLLICFVIWPSFHTQKAKLIPASNIYICCSSFLEHSPSRSFHGSLLLILRAPPNTTVSERLFLILPHPQLRQPAPQFHFIQYYITFGFQQKNTGCRDLHSVFFLPFPLECASLKAGILSFIHHCIPGTSNSASSSLS